MATQKIGEFSISLYMSNKSEGDKPKTSSITHAVPAAAITAYNAAADDAARAATLLGALVVATLELTRGTLAKVNAGFAYIQDATLPPTVSEQVFAFDAINSSFKAGIRFYNSGIPGRVLDPAILNLGSDGVSIDVGAGASAEVTAYIAAFNAVVLGINGSASTVVGMKISK